METKTILRKVAKRATRLLRNWGISNYTITVRERRLTPTYWGEGHWLNPTFVFCLRDGSEVGAYCNLLQTVRSYCGVRVDWRVGENYCRRERGGEPLNFPIHFFIALYTLFCHVSGMMRRKDEHLWLRASPSSVRLGYFGDETILLLTIHSYRKAKVETVGGVLKEGTLRQVVKYFIKTLATNLL